MTRTLVLGLGVLFVLSVAAAATIQTGNWFPQGVQVSDATFETPNCTVEAAGLLFFDISKNALLVCTGNSEWMNLTEAVLAVSTLRHEVDAQAQLIVDLQSENSRLAAVERHLFCDGNGTYDHETEQCLCDGGLYLDPSGHCEPVGAGHYSPVASNHRFPCPVDTYSDIQIAEACEDCGLHASTDGMNGTSISGACKCDGGYFRSGGVGACVLCPVDHFCPHYDDSSVPCPSQSDTNGLEGGSAVDDCHCLEGFRADVLLDSCVDINECVERMNVTGHCAHRCENEVPGWECGCDSGFSSNGTSCADPNAACTSESCTCSGGYTLNTFLATGVYEVTPALSCEHIRQLNPLATSGVYWITAAGSVDAFETECDFSTVSGGYSLAATFVNTDSDNKWTRPTGDTHWRTVSTFGDAHNPIAADTKTSVFNSMVADDILVKDAYGWVHFADTLNSNSMLSTLVSYTSCQTSPLVPPGDSRITGSSAVVQNGAFLTFYAGDPNAGDRCAFTGLHSDSATMALGGNSCGCVGLGQWGTNYNSGMDWHMSFASADMCIACDVPGCTAWYGYDLIGPNTHINNPSNADNSQWAALYVRENITYTPPSRPHRNLNVFDDCLVLAEFLWEQAIVVSSPTDTIVQTDVSSFAVSEFTIDVEIFLDDLSNAEKVILFAGDSFSVNAFFQLRAVSSALNYDVLVSGNWHTISLPSFFSEYSGLSFTEWTRITIVHSNADVEVFRDGQVVYSQRDWFAADATYVSGASKELRVGSRSDFSAILNGGVRRVNVFSGVHPPTSFPLCSEPLGDLASLIAWWPMTSLDSSGIDAFTPDVTPYGHHGRLKHGVTLQYDATVGDSVLTFDNDDSAMIVTPTDYFTMGVSDFTISVWVKFAGDSTQDEVIGYREVGGSGYFSFVIHTITDGRVRFFVGGTSSYSNVDTPSSHKVKDNTWHHIVGVRSSAGLELFIDKASAVSSSDRGPSIPGSTTENVRVGARYEDSSATAGTTANGSMRDLRVYRRALSTAEISAL